MICTGCLKVFLILFFHKFIILLLAFSHVHVVLASASHSPVKISIFSYSIDLSVVLFNTSTHTHWLIHNQCCFFSSFVLKNHYSRVNWGSLFLSPFLLVFYFLLFSSSLFSLLHDSAYLCASSLVLIVLFNILCLEIFA